MTKKAKQKNQKKFTKTHCRSHKNSLNDLFSANFTFMWPNFVKNRIGQQCRLDLHAFSSAIKKTKKILKTAIH